MPGRSLAPAIKAAGGKSRVYTKKTSGIFSRILFYFLLLVFFGTLVYMLLFSGLLMVSKIEVNGNNVVVKEDIIKLVSDNLDGRYLNLIEKNNLFLFNSSRFQKEIKDRFKIIREIGIKKKFPDIIEIFIQERTEVLIFSSAGKNWVIDELGNIFDESRGDLSYLGKSDIPIFSDESGKSFQLGDVPLDADYLSFIFDFRKRVEDMTEIDFSKEMHTPGIFSGDIRMKTQDGWELFLDKDLGADKEAEMLQVVLDNKIPKESRSNLEYIDLRTDNKVYYKFKNTSDQTEGDSDNEAGNITIKSDAADKSTDQDKKK